MATFLASRARQTDMPIATAIEISIPPEAAMQAPKDNGRCVRRHGRATTRRRDRGEVDRNAGEFLRPGRPELD